MKAIGVVQLSALCAKIRCANLEPLNHFDVSSLLRKKLSVHIAYRMSEMKHPAEVSG